MSNVWCLKLFQDDTVEGSKRQQDEMVSQILCLPVFTELSFDAVSTSWLQQWLSRPDLDSPIDNKKYVCQHGKLDPNEVPNVKYINSEIVSHCLG